MTLIALMIYAGIGAGCENAGWGFWKSVCWPGAVGRMIVRADKPTITAPGEGEER